MTIYVGSDNSIVEGDLSDDCHITQRYQYTALSTSGPDGAVSLGRPSSKPMIKWTDVSLFLVVLICLTTSILSVFSQNFAVFLGQNNQLVVVGFCLAIIAIITQRQLSTAFLLHQVQRGSLTLQDVEALLRANMFIPQTSTGSRLLLLFLLLLPLALSVAYKRFVGGISRIQIAAEPGAFGLTGAPGYQRIGLGLSLIPVTYLPFWMNPQLSKTYTSNFFVASNSTAAVLDLPLPEYIRSIQTTLTFDTAAIISAPVLGTVAEDIVLPSSLRENATYWDPYM